MAIRGVSLLDMDFSKEFPFEFVVQSNGCTKFNVMYTNDPDSVKLCLAVQAVPTGRESTRSQE